MFWISSHQHVQAQINQGKTSTYRHLQMHKHAPWHFFPSFLPIGSLSVKSFLCVVFVMISTFFRWFKSLCVSKSLSSVLSLSPHPPFLSQSVHLYQILTVLNALCIRNPFKSMLLEFKALYRHSINTDFGWVSLTQQTNQLLSKPAKSPSKLNSSNCSRFESSITESIKNRN